MAGRRRVCVTGIGLVSSLGHDRETTWANVLAGKSGAAPIEVFDAKTWPTSIACEVHNWTLPPEALNPEHLPWLSRPAGFGVGAAWEALVDSGIVSQVDPNRFGVCVGSNVGAVSPMRLAALVRGIDQTHPDFPRLSASNFGVGGSSHMVMQNHPGTLALVLSSRWQALGPTSTIHTACASSGQSLGQAFLQIQRGDADVMLAGGADSLAGELLLAGFCLLGALSRRNHDPEGASRPFDKDRDGFVAGEGAAMLVLEEREHALARGATIYAELAGYGETESAYRITDLPENGRGIVEAMRHAVDDAGLSPSDIDYVNAHGTSTELNDRIEALAIRRLFGSRGHVPLVSSTKSEVGHLICAAGAMEAAFCVLSIRDNRVPPTRNLNKTDCGEDIDFVPHVMRQTRVNAALSNSVGFGGTNSVVAFKRHD